MSNVSVELAVRTQNAVTDLAETVKARLADQRGQTAAEYMGLILLVAVIVLALTKAGIGRELSQGIKTAIGKVSEAG